MSKYYKVNGIVIHSQPLGEGGKILRLLTLEQGKIHAVAKGVAKMKSSMRGGSQLLSRGIYQLYQGRNLDTITQIEVESIFSVGKIGLEQFAYASYFAELVDRASLEKEPCPEIYSLFCQSLEMIKVMDLKITARFFELRLLFLLGYGFDLKKCNICGGKPTREVYLSTEGFCCEKCQTLAKGSQKVSLGILQTLFVLAEGSIRQLFCLRLSEEQQVQLETLIEGFLFEHLEKSSKAKKVLQDLFID